MRIKITFYLLFIIHLAYGQDEFIITHDYQNYFQAYTQSISTAEYSFVAGITVCNTGGCGILSKYNHQGELLFLKELSTIDINSYNCMTIIDEHIYITARYVHAPGILTLVFDFDGNLLEERIIQRDSDLDYVWPIDVLYLEDFYLVAVHENYENESRNEVIYKINYEGEVIQHVRLPNFFRSSIYTLDTLDNGNLFVSQSYIEDSTCIYHEDLDDKANAVILYEMDLESFEIIKSEDRFCHPASIRIGYDFTILPNKQFIRTVRWTNPDDPLERRAANIVYDEDWNEVSIHKYDKLELILPLFNGVESNRIFNSKDGSHYYVVAARVFDFIDVQNFFVDLIVEKWNLSHEIVWKRTISSPLTHKRLSFKSLSEQNDHLILTGSVGYDLTDFRRYDFAVLSLTKDGCFNNDCSDTIYIGEQIPVDVDDLPIQNNIIISPNPVKNYTSIESKSPCYKLELISSNGQIVQSIDIRHSNSYDLDM